MRIYDSFIFRVITFWKTTILSNLLYSLLFNKCTRMRIFAIMKDPWEFMPPVLFALFSLHSAKNRYILFRKICWPTPHIFLTTVHFVIVCKSDTCIISQAEYYANLNFITFLINSCNNLSLWIVAFYTSRWSFFISNEIYAWFSTVIREKMLHSGIRQDCKGVTFS